MYNSIRPGQVWLDTDGKPIQAHGFSVFWNEQEKLWYWYGEDKGIHQKRRHDLDLGHPLLHVQRSLQLGRPRAADPAQRGSQRAVAPHLLHRPPAYHLL